MSRSLYTIAILPYAEKHKKIKETLLKDKFNVITFKNWDQFSGYIKTGKVELLIICRSPSIEEKILA